MFSWSCVNYTRDFHKLQEWNRPRPGKANVVPVIELGCHVQQIMKKQSTHPVPSQYNPSIC